jgi:hypothetical protein
LDLGARSCIILPEHTEKEQEDLHVTAGFPLSTSLVILSDSYILQIPNLASEAPGGLELIEILHECGQIKSNLTQLLKMTYPLSQIPAGREKHIVVRSIRANVGSLGVAVWSSSEAASL